MTNEKLQELKKGVTNMLMICLMRLSDPTAKENVKQTTSDIYALIDQAKQPTSEAVKFPIGVLSEKLKEYKATYANSIQVKERIEREPEEFTWEWADGGYWVSVYEEYPKHIAELQTIITALRQMTAEPCVACQDAEHRMMVDGGTHCKYCGKRLGVDHE